MSPLGPQHGDCVVVACPAIFRPVGPVAPGLPAVPIAPVTVTHQSSWAEFKSIVM